jgi:hypothetical protein
MVYQPRLCSCLINCAGELDITRWGKREQAKREKPEVLVLALGFMLPPASQVLHSAVSLPETLI